MGALSRRARLGHGARGLQRERHGVGILQPRSGAQPRLPLERGWPRRHLRRGANPVLRAGTVERARPDPQGTRVRAHRQRRQPRRGREGSLFLQGRAALARLAAISLQIPAKRLPLPATGGRKRAPFAYRTGVRHRRFRRARQRTLLGRGSHLRQGEPDRNPHPYRRLQPRRCRRRTMRTAATVVPQYLELGRRHGQTRH